MAISKKMNKGPAALKFTVQNTALSFRATLLVDENPEVAKLVTAALPIDNFLTNTVVAGGTLQMGTKIFSLGGGNMVERVPGVVYFYAPGQNINICYGKVTETAKVNKFAQVYAEDLETLRAVGDLVRGQTMETADRTVVRMTVTLIGDNSPCLDVTTKLPDLIDDPVADPTHWRSVVAAMVHAVEQNWSEEPDDIRRTRLGVVKSGAGTNGSSFPVVLHQKAFTMLDGGGTLYRYLKLAQKDDISLDVLKTFTKAVFFETFNHFELFNDLGLETLSGIGLRYRGALDQVTTKEEYVQLTSPLAQLLNVFHRWVHLTFPWHHGPKHPHRTESDVAGQPKLATYTE